jgi:hypothetical protein
MLYVAALANVIRESLTMETPLASAVVRYFIAAGTPAVVVWSNESKNDP